MGITEAIKREAPDSGAQELAQVWDRPADETREDYVFTMAEVLASADRTGWATR